MQFIMVFNIHRQNPYDCIFYFGLRHEKHLQVFAHVIKPSFILNRLTIAI